MSRGRSLGSDRIIKWVWLDWGTRFEQVMVEVPHPSKKRNIEKEKKKE